MCRRQRDPYACPDMKWRRLDHDRQLKGGGDSFCGGDSQRHVSHVDNDCELIPSESNDYIRGTKD